MQKNRSKNLARNLKKSDVIAHTAKKIQTLSIWSAPAGTRTQDPHIKSVVLSTN